MHAHKLPAALLGLASFLLAGSALAAPDLRVQMPAPAPVHVYEEGGYDVVVANIGKHGAASVVLTIDLPATHTSPQVYVMGDLGAFDGRCSRSGTPPTCNLGALAKGQSTTVSFALALPVADEVLTLAASATTASGETALANNAASLSPALLHYATSVGDGDLASIDHCTGQGLTSFFECELFPSSLSSHQHVFNGDGTISIPEEPDYGGVWSQSSADTLSFAYLYAGEVVAEFEGVGSSPGCFQGITTFPGSSYLSPYEVCI